MVDVCFSDSLGGMLKLNRRELGSSYVLPLWLQLNYANLDGDIIEKQVRREIETAIEYLIAAGKIKICEEIVDEEDCYWQRTIAHA